MIVLCCLAVFPYKLSSDKDGTDTGLGSGSIHGDSASVTLEEQQAPQERHLVDAALDNSDADVSSDGGSERKQVFIHSCL